MKKILSAAVLGLAASAAMSAAVVPTFDTFGALPGATFGGTGIPNDRVAIATVAGDVTIALSATPRFSGPAVTDNGAGVYTVLAGVSPDAPSPADPYALWNFNVYIGGGSMSDTAFRVFWDFDPGADTDEAALGYVGANGADLPNPAQNSLNLGMNDLAVAALGVVPPAGVFDPNAVGQYSFMIAAYGVGPGGLAELGRVAIQVNVVAPNAAPEPGSLALAGVALLGAFGLRRGRRLQG